MMGPLTALIARNHRAAAPAGIVAVGSKETNKTVRYSDGASQMYVCDLPTGCAAGDVALLACGAPVSPGSAWAWGAPSGATTVPTGPAPLASNQQLTVAAYLYTVTADDVSAGVINVPVSVPSTESAVLCAVVADVYRGVSQHALDVAGEWTSAALDAHTSQTTATLPGVTTTSNGALLLYAFFGEFLGNPTVSPPAGWEHAYDGAIIVLGRRTQEGHGQTGNVTLDVTYNSSYLPSAYGALLFALRQSVPHITLAHNLPDLTVGQAFSGSLTAVNVDGATGDITLTASDLPDGITVGERTDYADGSVGFPVSGTPTTAGPFDATFNATNGTQSASYEWTGSVTAGAVNAEYIDGGDVQPSSTGTQDLTLSSLIQANDLIVITGFTRDNTIATPDGYERFLFQQNNGYDQWLFGFKKVATAADAGSTVTLSPLGSRGGGSYAVIRRAGAVPQIEQVQGMPAPKVGTSLYPVPALTSAGDGRIALCAISTVYSYYIGGNTPPYGYAFITGYWQGQTRFGAAQKALDANKDTSGNWYFPTTKDHDNAGTAAMIIY